MKECIYCFMKKFFIMNKFIFVGFFICVFLKLSYANQFYDPTECSSNTTNPGTRYTCDSYNNSSCETFVIYRASQNLRTISMISALFNRNPNEILPLNNISSVFDVLELGKEIIVPISCSCNDEYFQVNISYAVQENDTFTQISCEVFDSLLKAETLLEENPSQGNNPQVNSILKVPMKCSCPDNSSRIVGVKYLVTYSFVEGDYVRKVAQKFGVPSEDILAVNNLDLNPTVYPNTTILVPLKTEPVINVNIPNSDPPTPGFLPTIPVKTSKYAQLEGLYIGGSIVGFVLIVIAFISGSLYVKALRKIKAAKIPSLERQSPLSPRSPRTACSTPRSNLSGPFTNRSSTPSCLSPDLLAGIKYSLCNYSVEEIRKATNDFSEDVKLSSFVYKGLLENVEVMIKQMRFEDTRLVIDVHSKVNHKNIIKLLGVCYGENDFSWSYLVFEFPTHGCLRDCLSNSSSSLRWHKRTQVAFDIATGLHYLHYCIIPPYTHLTTDSRNIFVTQHWKGKLAVFGSNPGISTSKENESSTMVSFSDGLASEKMDIFAFGIVLLELISAREDKDGNLIKESIGFLGGGGSEGGCFEQLRNFIDPCLNEDYPLAEALCLAVLAKACVEDDPMKRPSIDDIMKVLSRMV